VLVASSYEQLPSADSVDLLENQSNDCNGNGLPDSCEPDCDGNGIADACDLRAGRDRDCDGNGVPDGCDSSCVECDADGDGCANDLDGAPDDATACGDSDGDACDDCSGGAFDPGQDGSDADADGFCAVADCDDGNPEVWAEPQPVVTLSVRRAGSSTLVDWSHPAAPGA
jgi:hypothetical protein